MVRRRTRSLVVPVAVLAVFLMAGCGRDAEETPPVPDAAQAGLSEGENPQVQRTSLKGLCVVGHEVRTFIPCGSKKVYWMEADAASLQAFQVAIERYTDEPFEPFFAEIGGRLSDDVGNGFAADYDGRFFVERLIRLAPASELDCDE